MGGAEERRGRAYSAHLGYLFTELPLEDRFAAAAQAGFSQVEHSDPYALPSARIRELCRDNGLEFVQLALPAGDRSRGERGLAAVPGREVEFREGLETALRYAEDVGARHVHAMAGILAEGLGWADVRQTYVDNLRFACGAAERCGKDVLVEAIGPATIARYALGDPALAVSVMEQIRAPNLAILLDAFHETNAGRDPAAFVRAHGALVAHVHLADHPGRHEPGTGTIDFVRLFAALDAVGYRGAFGLEYGPAAATLAGLGWRDRLSVGESPGSVDRPSQTPPSELRRAVVASRASMQGTQR